MNRVTTEMIADHINVPKQSLQRWMKSGLIGDEFRDPGRGKHREFTVADVCCLIIVKLIMRIINDQARAKVLAIAFRRAYSKGFMENEALIINARDDSAAFAVALSGDVSAMIRDLKSMDVAIPVTQIIDTAKELLEP